jgi:acyl-CoA thioesterase
MEHHNLSPREVLERMLEHDRFTAWLGLQIDEIKAGYCRLHFEIKADMLNGFGRVHGGILFSASDSALAFACNAHGILSVALDASISFTRPAVLGDVIFVEAKEVHLGNKTAVYDIRCQHASGHLVAHFKGTAYRTGRAIGTGAD